MIPFFAGLYDDSIGHDIKSTFCRVAFKILINKPMFLIHDHVPLPNGIFICYLSCPNSYFPVKSYFPPLQIYVPSPSYKTQIKPSFLSEALLLALSHDEFFSLYIFGFKLNSTLNKFSCNCFTFAYIPDKNKSKTFEIQCSFIQGH